MTTVMSNHEQRPKHRTLRKPENRIKPPLIDRRGNSVESGDDAEIPSEVSQ